MKNVALNDINSNVDSSESDAEEKQRATKGYK